MDRNSIALASIKVFTVALRKESVDRNMRLDVSYNIKETSLSARRAWIEILVGLVGCPVASRRSPQGERG